MELIRRNAPWQIYILWRKPPRGSSLSVSEALLYISITVFQWQVSLSPAAALNGHNFTFNEASCLFGCSMHHHFACPCVNSDVAAESQLWAGGRFMQQLFLEVDSMSRVFCHDCVLNGKATAASRLSPCYFILPMLSKLRLSFDSASVTFPNTFPISLETLIISVWWFIFSPSLCHFLLLCYGFPLICLLYLYTLQNIV